MSNQTGWRFCQKCHGLFFAGNPDQGTCPGGGTHDGSASGKYVMQFGDSALNAQPQGGWRWCRKCQGLFFVGDDEVLSPLMFGDDPFRRMCPAGNHHDGLQSGHYVMEFGEDGTGVQGGWRFCKKCFGLFFSTPGDITGHNIEFQGLCPDSEGFVHDASKSGPYHMHFELPEPPHDSGHEPVLPESVTLNSGAITSELSIGGFASLTMSHNGNFTFSGHMHDSGALGIDFLITVVAMTPSGIAITAQHSGHCAGTFTTGPRDDDWTIAGVNNQIRDNWAEASQSTLTTTNHANDTLTPQIGAALEEALKQALLAAGKAAIQGLISLV